MSATADEKAPTTGYRRIALDRLSSPEQLDQLMEVTRLRSWIALAGLGLLLLVALVWGFFGSVPTKIAAQGMLIMPGGLLDVYAPDEGNITQLLVQEGQLIAQGAPIASIVQPEIAGQIEDATNKLQGLRDQLEQLQGGSKLVRTLSAGELALARFNQQIAITETERNLDLLNRRLKETSVITSPYAGRVLEIKVRFGDAVGRNAPLMSLQLSAQESKSLQAVIYVPPGSGKNVAAGMPVQISPTTAASEEYGFLLGRVTYVSEFPSTREGMMRVLANESLVAGLSTQGPPFAVYASLLPDASSASGYKWSNSLGNGVKVNSGTPCDVFITIRQQRPIDLLLPTLRRASGI